MTFQELPIGQAFELNGLEYAKCSQKQAATHYHGKPITQNINPRLIVKPLQDD